jgi:hypothetical protein
VVGIPVLLRGLDASQEPPTPYQPASDNGFAACPAID